MSMNALQAPVDSPAANALIASKLRARADEARSAGLSMEAQRLTAFASTLLSRNDSVPVVRNSVRSLAALGGKSGKLWATVLQDFMPPKAVPPPEPSKPQQVAIPTQDTIPLQDLDTRIDALISERDGLYRRVDELTKAIIALQREKNADLCICHGCKRRSLKPRCDDCLRMEADAQHARHRAKIDNNGKPKRPCGCSLRGPHRAGCEHYVERELRRAR